MTEDEVPTLDDEQDESSEGTTEQATTGSDKPTSRESDRRTGTPGLRVPTDGSTSEQPTTAATDDKPAAPPSPFTKETPTPPAADGKPVTAKPTDAPGTDTGNAPGTVKPAAAPASTAPPQTGGGKPNTGADKPQHDKTGKDDPNGLPDLTKMDPSKALQLGTGLITPAVSAAAAIPTALAGFAAAPLQILQSLLAAYGKGTPTTPQQNSGTGKIEEIVNNLGKVNPTAALGTGKASSALQSRVGSQKTKATSLQTLDEKLEKALTDSKGNTLLGREKMQGIVDQVNSSLQSLGPIANTPAGQAQVFATISQALTQAGAVVSQTVGEDGVSSDTITQLANEYVQSAGTENPNSTSSDGSTRLTSGTALGSLTADSSQEEVAAAILAEAKRRGYSDEAAIAILATAWQESNLDPNADGGDQGIGGALGIFQQGSHYGEDRTDPNVNINSFFDRMERTGGSGSGQDIWQQIVGIQQHDGAWAGTDGDQWYLGTVQSRLSSATDMFNKLVSA